MEHPIEAAGGTRMTDGRETTVTADGAGLHSGHRHRLRATFLEGGGAAMPEHQLLELLLTYAIPRRDVNELAHQLIARYGSLSGVLSAEPRDLCAMPGMGENASTLIALTGSLSRLQSDARRKTGVSTPMLAARFCAAIIGLEKDETLLVLSLDKNRRVLHHDIVSRGSAASAALPLREIARCALRHGAHGVIIAHNHPSGDISPSIADVSATRSALEMLTAIDVLLHDHIIIGRERAYSIVSGREMDLSAEAETETSAPERKDGI